MSDQRISYMMVGLPYPRVFHGPAADIRDVQPVGHRRIPQARRQTRRLLQTGRSLNSHSTNKIVDT